MKLHRCSSKEGKPLGFLFWCSGCNEPHRVGETWAFNGDMERPTFNPSILVRGTNLTAEAASMIVRGESPPEGSQYPSVPFVCHSFIRDGRIEYCSDSTHALAGKTIDLPDMDEAEGSAPNANR